MLARFDIPPPAPHQRSARETCGTAPRNDSAPALRRCQSQKAKDKILESNRSRVPESPCPDDFLEVVQHENRSHYCFLSFSESSTNDLRFSLTRVLEQVCVVNERVTLLAL